MSSVHFTLQDQLQSLHATVDEELAHAIIGSLSADPETILELQAAMTRFVHPDLCNQIFAQWTRCDEPPRDVEPFCVIDLSARLIATSWQHDLDEGVSATPYLDAHGPSERWFAYHLSDTWLLTTDLRYWPTLSHERRKQRMGHPRIDLRQILYGDPLLEFLVQECQAALKTADLSLTRNGAKRVPADQYPPNHSAYQVARDIHARWLTLPQPQLQGRSVRDEMLAERSHIARDIEHRSHQWVWMGQCPPGLSEEDSAYRWGGLGTHEIIVYYDLVRYLLDRCLSRLAQGRSNEDVGFEWLERLRDHWLNQPEPDRTGNVSPREIIERERRRLPLVDEPGNEVDCDCPLCRMMLEPNAGPTFTYLGGFHLDEDFAFSFCQTEEDWQQEMVETDFDDELNLNEQADEGGKSLHDRPEPTLTRPITVARSTVFPSSTVWKTSYVTPDIAAEPPAARLFGVGTYLAEIITDLRQGADSQRLIDALNRQFDHLCQVNRDGQDRLLLPVVDRFCEQLKEVAQTRKELRPKCFALQQTLRLWFCEQNPLAEPIDRFPRDWT